MHIITRLVFSDHHLSRCVLLHLTCESSSARHRKLQTVALRLLNNICNPWPFCIVCAALQSDTWLLKANLTVLLSCKSCDVPRHALGASVQLSCLHQLAL